MESLTHPYYPLTATIPHFVPNATPLLQLLLSFGTLIATVLGFTYFFSGRSEPRLGPLDRFAACWFALCGFLHIAFEGYYILHRRDIAGRDTLFAELWKEYTLSDSRYLTLDIFTVCVETLTFLFWGPLSVVTCLNIITRSSTRHFSQVIISTAHLYGVALYYFTNWAENQATGVSYSRPEFLYYWVYYVGFNLPWLVVPLVLLANSFTEIKQAFDAQARNQIHVKKAQ